LEQKLADTVKIERAFHVRFDDQKVEKGKRPFSQDLTARIFAETGVLSANVNKLSDESMSCTKDDFTAWQGEVQFNQKSRRSAFSSRPTIAACSSAVIARFCLNTGLGHCRRGMTDFSSQSIPRA
jgi:hypothetical protein